MSTLRIRRHSRATARVQMMDRIMQKKKKKKEKTKEQLKNKNRE